MHFQIAEKGRFELFASVSTALPNPVHLQALVSIEKTGLDKKVIFNFETCLSPKTSLKIMQQGCSDGNL